MIALSNLSFPANVNSTFLETLVREGLSGVEVAPTRLAAWPDLTEMLLRTYRTKLADLGLKIPALQAIFFGVERAALLGDTSAFVRLLEHLRVVAGVAACLGASVAVLGSPQQRKRGRLSLKEAYALGAERLRRCAELVHNATGLIIGLEPVPSFYGCDFLESAEEALAMVRLVNHPGLRLHLDTACIRLAGSDITTAIEQGSPWLVHFHVAQPELGGFAAPLAEHKIAGSVLQRVGYKGWKSIEMRQIEDWQRATIQALRFTSRIYRDTKPTILACKLSF